MTGQLSAAGPVAVAFQEPRLVPWKKVLANVALGLRVADPQASARTALDEVGLAERASAWPATLSGGEAQRASLARALVREPRLLLLDEPFSALDALTRITMHRLVLSLWARHRPAVLLVTHDVDEALALADRVFSFSARGGLPTPRPSPCRGLGTVTTPTSSRCGSGCLPNSASRPGKPTDHLGNHMIKRTRFYAVTVLALAGLAAAGCSSSSSSTAGSSASTSSPSASGAVNLSAVTLNVGDQKGTGAEAVLTAAGLLNTLPFHVTWSDFTSGPPMLEAMASGSVDIGGVGDAPPVFAASGGEQVEIVGARQTNGDQDAVVVPKNSPITSIQQLKGKKIAYGSGSSANYNLLTVLTKAGLTTKDVTLVNLQPALALAAFTSGSVAAWDIWPPYVQQVVAQDGARVLATGSAYGSPYSFEVASKAAVANPDKAAAIRVYLKTLDKAYVWAASHPSSWAVAWGKAAGLPASVMEVAAKLDATTPAPITSATVSSEQNLVNQFFTAGLIPTKVNISSYITNEFNDTVSGSS